MDGEESRAPRYVIAGEPPDHGYVVRDPDGVGRHYRERLGDAVTLAENASEFWGAPVVVTDRKVTHGKFVPTVNPTEEAQ